MSIELCGKTIDKINVTISYRIIELFSAGLYSSPNKAFEELVCNAYDAFADKVAVFISSDLSVDNACIWVCDNGESMDSNELKELWQIGKSTKRENPERDNKRLQIGRFGIGKLATYVLANRLTHICKKNGRFLATTMDYAKISTEKDEDVLALDEREISEDELKRTLKPYVNISGNKIIPFELFGDHAEESWTFSILTNLKPKAMEIREGRLKWVLRTALPINPRFKLFFNGPELLSSKIDRPIKKIWVFGKDDDTINRLDSVSARSVQEKCYIDFPNLKGVYGQIELYEDSLVDATKSNTLGRSHGIFLMVRGRLINIDDPLLGMEAFSHGPFNRSRIVVYADGLDDNLTSTRESIKESPPLLQLKEYLKSKFNNEVRKYYFEEENRLNKEQLISYRLSKTSLTISKRPLYAFALKYFNNEISNPFLLEKPDIATKTELLADLKTELMEVESFIKEIDWCILNSSDPIARFDLSSGNLKINLLHPFIANYIDVYKNTLPVQFFAITEVLTEAHLYEIGIDEADINTIMRRRDVTFRELSLSEREGAPVVAQILKDSIADPTGLEDAVYKAFLALGFEVTKIGGKGKPDGKAHAVLGFSDPDKNENYSIIYDAKSTGKDKIQAATAKLSGIKRHQKDYDANYAVVIAVDFEGSQDITSAISKEAKQQKITILKATDLMRLLLLYVPKQIGLKTLRELFETCHSPVDTSAWIDRIKDKQIDIGPFNELLEIIYDFQKTDTESPEIASVRVKLNEKMKKNYSKNEIKSMIESIKVFVPGLVSVEDEKVGIQSKPEQIMRTIRGAINDVPSSFQEMYLEAFSQSERKSKK